MTHLLRTLVTVSPFLYPAYFFRFQVLGVPFTVLEVYIYFLFGLWILSRFQAKKSSFRIPIPLYFWCAALLFLGASLGVLIAPGFIELPDGTLFDAQRVALGVWKGWIVAPLLYFFVLTQSLHTPSQVEKLLRAFVYSAVVISLLAYGLALFGLGITYDLRLSGIYESANYLALYLVPAVLFNIAWVLQRKPPVQRKHYVDTATLTILLHALFFTQSYAAVLAVFGSLILYGIYFMVRYRGKTKRAFLGVLILVATLSVIAFSQLNAPKFRQFLEFQNRSSTTVRFEIYQVTYALVKQNWLLGHGPGLFQANYQTEATKVLGRPPLEWNIPHPHNIFFAFWLNAGLLGLLALLWIHVLVHRQFTYPLLAFWGIILHGFFDTPFWKNDLAMIFWLVIAAILLFQFYGTHSTSNRPTGTRVRSSGRTQKRA